MRLTKYSQTLLTLALLPIVSACAFAQVNVNPNAVRDQLMKATPGQAQPQAAPPKQAPALKAPAAAKAPVKTPATLPVKAAPSDSTPASRTKGSSSAAAKTPATPASPKLTKTAVEKPAEEKPTARRDPFETLLNKTKPTNAAPENLPPGKAGLVVAALRIDGIVRNSGGMIAIVSNAQQRVYFLREGDRLYDGAVNKITLDAVSFNEVGKDAFGKPLERQVTKRLYPSPGEQQ